jgi:hypothetical protein
MGRKYGLIMLSTKGNIKMDPNTAKESLNGRMVPFMKESLSIIVWMAMASTTGTMAKSILEL